MADIVQGPGQAQGAKALLSARGPRREARLSAAARLSQPWLCCWGRGQESAFGNDMGVLEGGGGEPPQPSEGRRWGRLHARARPGLPASGSVAAAFALSSPRRRQCGDLTCQPRRRPFRLLPRLCLASSSSSRRRRRRLALGGRHVLC